MKVRNFRKQLRHQFTITSVRARLTLWSVFVLALVLVAMGTILRYTLQLHLTASIDRELARRGGFQQRWVMQVLEMPRRYASTSPPRARRDTENTSGLRFRPRTFNLEGGPLFPGSSDVLWDKDAFARAVRGDASYITIRNNEEMVRVYSVPLYHRGEIAGVMQAGYSLTEMDRDLEGLSSTLIMLIPIALLTVGAGAAFLMGRLLRPVREVTQAASTISAADLSQRLPVSGGDEFSRLSTTFNAMLARLEQSFEQQRRFTADASHELRTPLTAIKARTSLALDSAKTVADYRRALESADRAATRMSRIVDDLLLMARSDTGQLRVDRQPLRIGEVVEAATETVQGENQAPIHLQQDDPTLCVMGDSGHLIRLFTNLLDNAVQHTPPEGRILLVAEGERDRVRITVTDTGRGIAPEHIPHLCERFYRVDEARGRKQGGTGLGLSISQSIVEAHHGQLLIESVLGEGTMVTVTLPRLDASRLPKEIESEVFQEKSLSQPQVS